MATHHPRRADGTFIKDSLTPAHYMQIKAEFRTMERALGELHKRNRVPYVLRQPILGWESDGRHPFKTRFNDMPCKGVNDPLTLYVYTDAWNGRREAEVNTFLVHVRRHAPSEFRIVHDDYRYRYTV